MADKELLKAAAKAAGWPVTGLAPAYMCEPGTDLALIIRNDRGGESVWNPLESDGDAFRLAVKLLLNVNFDQPLHVAVIDGNCWRTTEEKGNDTAAATRRAIVRAAANQSGTHD
jgi:hypothetical protein